MVDQVHPGTQLAKEEIIGPVLSVARINDLEEALCLGRQYLYGNGAPIFTRSGWAAREFKYRFNAGMIGINVSVPAPLAWFPFTGWNQPFFGELHVGGVEGVHFYTRQKLTMTRWFASSRESFQDPIWKR
jgi:malonate-semialdehyde dehydrogenase (acetylating)/methylmalonate-semialdehyde dehydrogenase